METEGVFAPETLADAREAYESVGPAAQTVVRETARNRSSMLQDVTRGRRTEIDAINGYVVDRAAATDRAAPVNRTLAALIGGWERGAGVGPSGDE